MHEEMKLTDKPLSFGYSVVDSHSSCRPVKAKNPPAYTDGFYEEVKLTDKPLSFGYSVVDSHSSCRPVKAKTRQLTLTGFMKR
ncbi:hypothetical protein EFJ00_15525 [Salmonella enterica]|nr:hypothetical protein [Salmonella enterica]EAM6287903.1 hypothetical protein [Salmonella enterica]EAN5958186.1 hypothetical protein [Salmonella enterica]EAU5423450.1 hypothetical protein [Salmonella enterica]EAU7754038.1 hypothetical protein [Salmonella enterica]